MQDQRIKIWTLGSRCRNADRSIDWNRPLFPNLNDSDILIINLDSLDEPTLKRINKNKFLSARDMIFNKFLAHPQSVLIYIVSNSSLYKHKKREPKKSIASRKYPADFIKSPPKFFTYSNFDLMPILFTIEGVAEGRNIKLLNSNNRFHPYFDYITSFKHILRDFILSPSLSYVPPTNEVSKTIIDRIDSNAMDNHIELVVDPIAEDNSHNVLASICYLKIDGYWNSAKAVFFPPTEKGTIQQAIDIIIEIYRKVGQYTSLPDWVYKNKMPGLQELETEKTKLDRQLRTIEEKISQVIKRKKILEDHYLLLSGKNTPLESAVRDAFKILGFKEIKKKRSSEKEDWVIRFKTTTNQGFEYGILEVKGADARTGLDDLRQCADWINGLKKNLIQLLKAFLFPINLDLSLIRNRK